MRNSNYSHNYFFPFSIVFLDECTWSVSCQTGRKTFIFLESFSNKARKETEISGNVFPSCIPKTILTPAWFWNSFCYYNSIYFWSQVLCILTLKIHVLLTTEKRESENVFKVFPTDNYAFECEINILINVTNIWAEGMRLRMLISLFSCLCNICSERTHEKQIQKVHLIQQRPEFQQESIFLPL